MSLEFDPKAVELVDERGRLSWGRKTRFRKREPRRRALDWEREVLALIIDQYAVPLDQLARFMGCSQRRAEAIVEHLMRVGYVDYDRILSTERPWVWLTRRGAHFSGRDHLVFPVNVGAMPRIRAVNEVRLHLEGRAPDAVWVSGRGVMRRYGRTGSRVHGMLEVGEENHAIKVELVRKGYGRSCIGVETLLERFDAVVVFCVEETRDIYERMKDEHEWPRLVVRELPQPAHRGG